MSARWFGMKAVAGRSASRPLLKPTGTRQARATVSSMPQSTSSAAHANSSKSHPYTRRTERQWGYATETLHPTDERRLLCRLTVDLVGHPRRAALRVVEVGLVGDPAALAGLRR